MFVYPSEGGLASVFVSLTERGMNLFPFVPVKEVWPLCLLVLIKGYDFDPISSTEGGVTSVLVSSSEGAVTSLFVRPTERGVDLFPSVPLKEVWLLFLSVPMKDMWPVCLFHGRTCGLCVCQFQ